MRKLKKMFYIIHGFYTDLKQLSAEFLLFK